MIKIVTDSTSDIPSDLVKKYKIDIIPLSIILGDEVYRDRIDMDQDEFYDRLRRANAFPQTQSPTTEDFIKLYESYLNDFDQIISIHISRKMSSTLVKAENAKKALNVGDDKIIILDSKSASFGLGLQVLELFQKYQNSPEISTKEIDLFCNQIIDKTKVIFGIPSLDLLKRGGRLGAAQELVGSLLGFKPILSVEDGEISAKGKVKDKKEFPETILNFMKNELKENQKIKAGIFHWRSEKEADILKNLVSEHFHCVELYNANAGSVIGAHTGYGAVGVTYYPID